MTVLTVFRSRLKDTDQAEYHALAPKIAELACGMAGYVSHKAFTAADGERVTIVEFADEASHRAWATQADHVAVKKRGREAFYAEYSIQVCTVNRESRFPTP